jgi:hypothetical protein
VQQVVPCPTGAALGAGGAAVDAAFAGAVLAALAGWVAFAAAFAVLLASSWVTVAGGFLAREATAAFASCTTFPGGWCRR